MTPIRNLAAPGAGGGGWTRSGTTLERLFPDMAGNAQTYQGVAAWAWGPYRDLSASTPADYVPAGVHLHYVMTPKIPSLLYVSGELEIATGAAGAEVPYAVLPTAAMSYLIGDLTVALISTGWTLPIGPTVIPAGTRITARSRQSVPDTSAGSACGVYLTGHDVTLPPSDLTYPLDAHLAGDHASQMKTTPTGTTINVLSLSYPTWRPWQEVMASAPSDLLAWGTAYVAVFELGIQGHHLQFGIGEAGSEVPYALVGCPADFPLGAGQQWLRRPLLIKAGERWSVRSSGLGSSFEHQFFYEEL